MKEFADNLYSSEFSEPADLDEKDKAILDELQRNARKSITDIARDTGIKRHVVKYRINKLEDEGVIRGYHAYLDPSKLGKPLFFFIHFELTNLTPEREEALVDHLKDIPNVVYLAKTGGRWDYSANLCVKDYNEVNTILRGVRQEFSDLIKDFEQGSAIQEYKFDYMVDLIDTDE